MWLGEQGGIFCQVWARLAVPTPYLSSDAWPVALNGRTIDSSFVIFWLEGVNVSGGVSAYHGGGVDVTKGVVSVSVPFFLRHRRAGNDNESYFNQSSSVFQSA